MKNITVSIVCNTYNHEKYIRDALEGFINQVTDFDYEVLVHDDASTDGTADIIREYEAKYPKLIKPIYQTVNQYSQGLKPGRQNRARAVGKYIAVCEGDDYWIDSYKLQKQVDYMEAHPECTFCFTNGLTRYGDEVKQKVVPWDKQAIIKKNDSDYTVGELELLGYIPTASFLYPRELKYAELPKGAFSGDTFTKLSMTNYGYAHFIDEPMVVYRRAVGESATAIWAKKPEVYANQCEAFVLLYEALKEITNHRYDDVLNLRTTQWKIEKHFTLKDYCSLKKISESGELKHLQRGNLYSRIIFVSKCRFAKQFSMLHTFLKSTFKFLNK